MSGKGLSGKGCGVRKKTPQNYPGAALYLPDSDTGFDFLQPSVSLLVRTRSTERSVLIHGEVTRRARAGICKAGSQFGGYFGSFSQSVSTWLVLNAVLQEKIEQPNGQM